tara:strand:+ start:205 stop:318 length:114 start_codon:yes stop_codon:yes gene_type:complete
MKRKDYQEIVFYILLGVSFAAAFDLILLACGHETAAF